METVQLQDATEVVEVNPGYRVEFEAGEYMVVCTGLTDGKTFQHPNILRQESKEFNFKHYLPGGGKRWSSKDGIELYFAVPKGHIFVVLEEGYSYVPVMIGGVKFQLNVSGGSNYNEETKESGWTDWVHEIAHTSVNHPKKDLLALAACAMPAEVVPAEVLQRLQAAIDRENEVRNA